MRILIGLFFCFAGVNCKIFPECYGIPSGYYVANSRQNGCQSFIYCNGENSFEAMCSIGLVFNPVELSCEPKENFDCDDNIKMDVSPIKTLPSPSNKRIVLVETKQHPTPPGKLFIATKSTTMSSLEEYSNRPASTVKLLRTSTFAPRKTPKPQRTNSPTKLISTTPKTTPMINRPLPVPTNGASERPKTPAPTRKSTKTSQPMRTKSPIHLPTPPGPLNVPDQSNETVLPNEKQPTSSSTERSSNWSSTKSHPKIKTPSSPTTKKSQTELFTSSTTGLNKISASIQEQCTKKSVGSFADPDDCRFYYRCIGGVLIKQECPKRFGWDSKSKMCTSNGCLK